MQPVTLVAVLEEPLAALVAVGSNNVFFKTFGALEFNQMHTGAFSH